MFKKLKLNLTQDELDKAAFLHGGDYIQVKYFYVEKQIKLFNKFKT